MMKILKYLKKYNKMKINKIVMINYKKKLLMNLN